MCILIHILNIYINISKIFRNKFLKLFGAVLGLRCCVGFSLMGKAGARASRRRGFSWSTGSRAPRLQWLQHVGSVVMAPEL